MAAGQVRHLGRVASDFPRPRGDWGNYPFLRDSGRLRLELPEPTLFVARIRVHMAAIAKAAELIVSWCLLNMAGQAHAVRPDRRV